MDHQPTEIISPPADATAFEAGGTRYTATDGLSVARLRIFDRLAQEFGSDASLRAMMEAHEAMEKAYSTLDMPQLGHLIFQRREALNLTGKNRLKEVEICGLFFNAPDEDAGAYDFTAMQAKCYGAWASVAGGFFSTAALRLLPTSRGSYGRLLDEAPLPTPEANDAP